MPKPVALCRMPLLVLTILSLLSVGLVVLPTSPAAAADPTFSMSVTSGPAGSMVYLTADPCPAPPAPSTQSAIVVTTTFPGDRPRSFRFNEQPWFLVPTQWDNQADTPPGTYSIGLACHPNIDTSTQPYARFVSQSFTVTAPPMHLQVTPATATPGGSLTVTPTVPCPAGSTQVSVGLVSDFSTWARDPSVTVTPAANGGWTSAQLTVPTNATASQFAVWAGCYAGTRLVAVYAAPRIAAGTASPPPTVRNYVALGDSYSSGEGNPPFDGAAGGCNRSQTNAWPRLMSFMTGQQVTLLACSGAETSALFGTYQGQEPQLTALARLQPRLVTITMGGNDLGFPSIMKACALTPSCLPQLTGVKLALPGFERTMTRVYREVASASRNASVIVVGYPAITPRSLLPNVQARCPWLSRSEVIGLQQISRELDRSLRRAANAANVRYVSTLDTLRGHELCTGEPWVNTVGTTSGAVSGQAHPNQFGQQAIAASLTTYVRRQGLV